MPVSLTPKLVDPDESKKDRLLQYTVGDYMVKSVLTVKPSDAIFDAISLLIKKQISGTPVVDEGNRLIGMLSEKDCLTILSKRAYHQSVSGTVAEYMTTKVETVSPDMALVDLAERMAAPNFPFRRLPVVKDGKLVGQISRRDLLIAIQENHKTSGA